MSSIQWYSLEKASADSRSKSAEANYAWMGDSEYFRIFSESIWKGNEQEQYWLDCCMNGLIQHGILEDTL